MNEVQQITENAGMGLLWVTPLIYAAGIVLGLVGLGWQLRRQHQTAIDAQREQIREQLRLEIYHEIAAKNQTCSSALTQFGMDIFLFPLSLKQRMRMYSQFKRDPGPGVHTAERFSTGQARTSEGVIDVMSVLEKYEIALPGFHIFKEKLSKLSDDLREGYSKFHEKIALIISHELLSEAGIPPWFPNEKGLDELSDMASKLHGIEVGMQGVLWDLRVEAQNNLLSNLFKDRVPPRKPGDTQVEVLRVDVASKENK